MGGQTSRWNGTRKMPVWTLVVCQSRNWEAFRADLWGQELPKAPLHNNCWPGNWQWDTEHWCRPPLPSFLKVTIPPPPFYLPPEHQQPMQEIETVWNHERREWRLRIRYYLADMICVECGSDFLNLNRHVSNVRQPQTNGWAQQSSVLLTSVQEQFTELHKAYVTLTIWTVQLKPA